MGNGSVRVLDLSHNMIGDKETYNFVRPDYTTGGEAVAEMIEVPRVSVWNRFGAPGVEARVATDEKAIHPL